MKHTVSTVIIQIRAKPHGTAIILLADCNSYQRACKVDCRFITLQTNTGGQTKARSPIDGGSYELKNRL